MSLLGRLIATIGRAEAQAAPAASAAPTDVNALVEVAHAQRVLTAQSLIGALLARPEYADPLRLERHGYKTWSQQDEDGIIAEIFRRIGVAHYSFIEFGAGDGRENNTTALLTQGWRGLWVDGNSNNAASLRHHFDPLVQASLLHLSNAFVTRDNAAGIVAAAGLGAEIDLLSIDLDGNDYHVWESLDTVNPRVVVIEYNARFRPPADWVMPYDANHSWDGTDNFGASLCAFDRLARTKGYRLAGCNLTGANAFFVRADLAHDLFFDPASPQLLFQPARYELMWGFTSGHPPSAATIVTAALAARRAATG